MHDIEPAAGFSGQDITYEKPAPSRPRRWPWYAAAAAVAASGGLAAVLLLSTSPPPVSPGCARAVAAQDKFVAEAVAAGYPDGMSLSDAYTIQIADIKLTGDVIDAHCPGDLTVSVLPDVGGS